MAGPARAGHGQTAADRQARGRTFLTASQRKRLMEPNAVGRLLKNTQSCPDFCDFVFAVDSVARRYMSLETLARITENTIIKLRAVAA
ncbi:MAG: hypothetical protein IOC82_03495 [Aestuariivirga sp.]|uniref:hypothetical protein n=1 Tax=Aestuariivirga sp. TaxID=2650926 RepID=UPI0025C46F56|nr:hypothetical protein [Aestuariivirga sp.]MCA3560079.1 hypothetical protein [Aestuariivirga sp.]